MLDIHAPEVIERWVGVYPSGPDTAFIEAVSDGVRLVNVTSGTGASTALRHCRGNPGRPARPAAAAACWGARHMTDSSKPSILDWAGTVVDFGSRAPMGAFVRAFARVRRRDQHRRRARADGHGEVGPHPRRRQRAASRRRVAGAAWARLHRCRRGRDLRGVRADERRLGASTTPASFPARWRRSPRCAPRASGSVQRPATRARSWQR